MKPWLEDPDVDADLRLDLLRSRAAGRRYDAEGKLPQLREALERPPTAMADLEDALSTSASASSPLLGAKLTALAIAGAGAALLVLTTLNWPAPPANPSGANPQADLHEGKSTETDPANRRPATGDALETDAGVADGRQRSHHSAAPGARLEIAEMVKIRALLKPDPETAYNLARASQLRFPDGIFVEERSAYIALALAAMGEHNAARQQARAFLTRYRRSPMREAVQAILAK